MAKPIYATLFEDGYVMPAGFVKFADGDAFRWDDDAVTHEHEAAELETRLDLALAALESLGIELSFSESAGDAEGNLPEEGYVSLDAPSEGGPPYDAATATGMYDPEKRS